MRARSLLLAIIAWLLTVPVPLAAQEVKIWEFSPYEVKIWYQFEPSVRLSEVAKEQYLKRLDAALRSTFRATWTTQIAPLPPQLASLVSRNIDGFTLEQLTANELVVVASLEHEQSKTVRTLEAAIDKVDSIRIAGDALERLKSEAERLQLPEDSVTSRLIAKCELDEEGVASLKQKLQDAEIPAAILPRSEIKEVLSAARTIVTPLPWQSDQIFRQIDKLFLLRIEQAGDDLAFRIRELDCPMQFLGPTFEATAQDWSQAARVTSHALVRAFAPIARVEDAETKTAVLRLRAGGLIVTSDNPSEIQVGHVLQPIVRRDDRNGIPTLLEPLSWTFAAVTASDGVKLDTNVYTYSGGPGLQGRKNRRTRRVLLRVRPRFDNTDIRIAVRGEEERSQAGCFVYRRDLLTEEFELLGRTDWRGRFNVPVPERFGGFLPEAIRKERYLAKRAAEKKAAEAKAQAEAAGEGGDTVEDAVAAVEAPPVYDPDQDPDALPLQAPLTQIYIKSGDTVLAKLPMVPGLKEIEIAKLPDDSRRLQAEAFVRGFQGDILDLIGMRNLLAAQVQLYLKQNRLPQAEDALESLRRLRNYNEMADELESIQRVMMDESTGPISFGAKRSIDRMFQTTRELLQKYLQDNLLRDAEQAVKLHKAARPSDSPTPDASSPDATPVAGT